MRRTIRGMSILVAIVCGSLLGCETLSITAQMPAEPDVEPARPPGSERATPAEESDGHELRGYASWYGGKFQGRLTANGERFDTNLLTAAHKTLPFDTIVEVTHLDNGRTVQVRINDRGPFVEGRVIDLSRAAAEAIDMTAQGIAMVEVRIIGRIEPQFTIQIGSYAERQNARAVRDSLLESGIDAEIEQSRQVHRVIMKDILESELEREKARLAELGHESVLVRQQRSQN
ncbi:MAG: septal ring lytic transglycosylase RlpA family protein [Spirochaetales bacterium]